MSREEFEKDVGKGLKKRLKTELGREPSSVECKDYIDKTYDKYLEHIDGK